MVFPKSATLDTRGKTCSGYGEIEMFPEIQRGVSRHIRTNGNLLSPVSRISDLSASWEVPIVRIADSRWGKHVVF